MISDLTFFLKKNLNTKRVAVNNTENQKKRKLMDIPGMIMCGIKRV